LLTWTTPTHEDDEFWRENAKKLENKDKKIIKALLAILKKNDQEHAVLAIACNDLAQYMKYVENGRKVVTDLGGKAPIMQLMTHQDADVKFRALIAVQRLVSHSWTTV